MKYYDTDPYPHHVDPDTSAERFSTGVETSRKPGIRQLLVRLGAIAAVAAGGNWLVQNYEDDTLTRTPPEDAVCTEYSNPYRQGHIDRADLYVDGGTNIRALGSRIAKIAGAEQEVVICFDGEMNRAYAQSQVDASQMVSESEFTPYYTDVD